MRGHEERRGSTIGVFVAAAVVNGMTLDSWAAEHAAGSPELPASCIVNEGEWSWHSDALDLAVGVDEVGDVSYVDLILHRPEVCVGLGPARTRVVVPWPHGWTGADCVWDDDLCQGDSLGISVFVLFRYPEDHLAQCRFTLRRIQPTCETCDVLRNVTLTRQPPTAVEARQWGRVKRLYR